MSSLSGLRGPTSPPASSTIRGLCDKHLPPLLLVCWAGRRGTWLHWTQVRMSLAPATRSAKHWQQNPARSAKHPLESLEKGKQRETWRIFKKIFSPHVFRTKSFKYDRKIIIPNVMVIKCVDVNMGT